MDVSGTAFQRRLALGPATGAGVSAWGALRTILFVAVLAWLLYAGTRIFLMLTGQPIPRPEPWMLALAAAVYLLSHGLRILRLALLIGDSRTGLRSIASFQLTTAAAALATPFKLGEIYRLYELAHIAGGLMRAIIIIWWERAFDAVCLLLILLVTLANGDHIVQFWGLAATVSLFLVGTALTVFIVPENLRRLSVLVIRRYSSPRTVPLLQSLELIRRAILEAPRLVRGKVASLIVLTVLIWMAQLGCIVLAYPALGGDWTAASEALLDFLSSLLQSHSPVSPLYDPSPDLITEAQALAEAPLLLVGVIAGLYYLKICIRPGRYFGGWAARRSNS